MPLVFGFTIAILIGHFVFNETDAFFFNNEHTLNKIGSITVVLAVLSTIQCVLIMAIRQQPLETKNQLKTTAKSGMTYLSGLQLGLILSTFFTFIAQQEYITNQFRFTRQQSRLFLFSLAIGAMWGPAAYQLIKALTDRKPRLFPWMFPALYAVIVTILLVTLEYAKNEWLTNILIFLAAISIQCSLV